MKVRLEEGLQLVITPESYVEQVALSKWADTVKGECALLVEAYAQQPLAAPDVCKSCGTHFIASGEVKPWEFCPVCGARR